MFSGDDDSTKAFLGDCPDVRQDGHGSGSRPPASEVATATRTGAKTVAGQAAAQGRRVASPPPARQPSSSTTPSTPLTAATPSSSRGRARRYEQWTKAELVERAKELDIAGRTGLNKAELIKALRKHS